MVQRRNVETSVIFMEKSLIKIFHAIMTSLMTMHSIIKTDFLKTFESLIGEKEKSFCGNNQNVDLNLTFFCYVNLSFKTNLKRIMISRTT